MQKDDLVSKDPETGEWDVPVDLDSVGWQEYHVRCLVPRDPKGSIADVNPQWWADQAEALMEKVQKGAPMTMREWFMWDVFRSWEDDVRVMGPTHKAVACEENGHVVAEDDLKHDEDGYELCEACTDEAVAAAEARADA